MRGGGGIRAGVPQQTPAAALGLSRSELERQRLCVCERERESARMCLPAAALGLSRSELERQRLCVRERACACAEPTFSRACARRASAADPHAAICLGKENQEWKRV